MDLQDKANGKIRGLALRSLCSLKFDGVLEYMQQGIEIGFKDPEAYVKKTAIMGCVKMFHINKSSFKKTHMQYLDTLYSLIHDHDPLVVINAI